MLIYFMHLGSKKILLSEEQWGKKSIFIAFENNLGRLVFIAVNCF